MAYKVKIDVFEGPFDLLVYLIESAKMNIYDISISEITDQYLEYMKDLDSVEMDNAAQFLLLAATLVELKSRKLLPGAEKESAEEEQEDPRKNLMERLIEYKRFKEVAAKLSLREDENLLRWYKPQEDLTEYLLQEEERVNLSIDPQQFLKVFRLFLERREKIDEIHRRYRTGRGGRKRTSIREKMNFIRKFLSKEASVSFLHIANACEDRYDVAATFVAMLEMMRSGQIQVRQEDRFGEIIIRAGSENAKLPRGDSPRAEGNADLAEKELAEGNPAGGELPVRDLAEGDFETDFEAGASDAIEGGGV